MVEAGSQAPAVELTDADGKRVRLEDVTGPRPVLLAFFKITCPVCQFTFPFLERLSAAGAVVGISQDDPESTAEFCKAYGITFPMLYDRPEAYAASNAWGITHVPSLFLLESDGRVVQAGAGFSRHDLEAAAARFRTTLFRDERVPEFRPG
jgi:peroxiredoxin